MCVRMFHTCVHTFYICVHAFQVCVCVRAFHIYVSAQGDFTCVCVTKFEMSPKVPLIEHVYLQ